MRERASRSRGRWRGRSRLPTEQGSSTDSIQIFTQFLPGFNSRGHKLAVHRPHLSLRQILFGMSNDL